MGENDNTYYVDRDGSMSVVHGVVELGELTPLTTHLPKYKKRRNDTSRIRTCAPKGK